MVSTLRPSVLSRRRYLTEWHLAKPDLAPVLSAALFGLAFGALVSGPLSDRVGRRSLMVGSVFLFGVACVASAFSDEHRSTDCAALHDGHRPRRSDGKRSDHDGRVLPDPTPRHGDQPDVLRIPARRGFGRTACGMAGSPCRLAKCSDAGRRHADTSRCPAIAQDAGIGALHGCKRQARGAHSRRSRAHLR